MLVDRSGRRGPAVRAAAHVLAMLIATAFSLGAQTSAALASESLDTMPGGSLQLAFAKSDRVAVTVKSKSGKVALAGKSAKKGSSWVTGSSGGGVKWVANAGCLNASLKSVIHEVASQFGSVTVSSTCRSASRNRAVGGARRSYHLSGDAADFRVHGNVAAAAAYLRGRVGGFKSYGGGLFHIDTGPRRPMG